MNFIAHCWQTIAALLIVFLAFVLLLRGSWKRSRPGKQGHCGGGCGCSAAKQTKIHQKDDL